MDVRNHTSAADLAGRGPDFQGKRKRPPGLYRPVRRGGDFQGHRRARNGPGKDRPGRHLRRDGADRFPPRMAGARASKG